MMTKLDKLKNRCISIRGHFTASEISGSLGDLGTLLPLLVALSSQRSISLAPALFWGGVTNLLTGLTWDVPMCVQPMKSISAVALSESWGAGKVTASGICVGALTFILGATNLIEILNKIVPRNVVGGLQIGVGVRLASKGIFMVSALGWANTHDCILLGVICAVLCLYWLREGQVNDQVDLNAARSKSTMATGKKAIFGKIMCCCRSSSKDRGHPVGLYLFLIGVLFASITLGTTPNENERFDLPLRFFGAPIAYWAAGDISASDWAPSILEGALPQLPLTTLNSVISVCALAHSLYPEKRKIDAKEGSNDAVISRREVAISVGLMNLLFCPFGSMPNCHGAGGLAGQHRLGARHGASVIFLGVSKIMLGIFFGRSALTLLDAFPDAVLGVMLAIAGQELATTGFTLLVRSIDNEVRSIDNEVGGILLEGNRAATRKAELLRQNTVVAVITATVIISLGKTHYGALSGSVAHLIYGTGALELKVWWEARQENDPESQSSETSPSAKFGGQDLFPVASENVGSTKKENSNEEKHRQLIQQL